MDARHDELRELLPQYLKGTLDERLGAKVRDHVIGCVECREELGLLADLAADAVPDPGDLYWQTLPQRVTAIAASERKGRQPWWSSIMKPVRLAAAASLALAAATLLAFWPVEPPVPLVARNDTPQVDTGSKAPDPAPKATDAAKPGKQAVIAEQKPDHAASAVDHALGEELYALVDDPAGISFGGDLASLDERELERLYRALEGDRAAGGDA